jgi:hypothetical protein
MFDGQMEMSFGKATRQAGKPTRARWWFQRMRQIVDRATDWQPAPQPRPVQIWFPTAEERLNGSVPIGRGQRAKTAAEERQMCA